MPTIAHEINRRPLRGWVALLVILFAGTTLFGCAWFSAAAAYAAPMGGNSDVGYDARYMESRLLLTSGNNDRALRLLEPLTKNADCPDFIFEAAIRAAMANNKGDLALETASEAINRFPESVDLLILRAGVLREKGRIAESIADLHTASGLAPNRQNILEMLSELHLSRLISNPADADKEVQELINVYNRMLAGRQGTDRLVPLLVISTLYLKSNQIDKAVEAAAEARSLRPDSTRVLEAYASALVAAGKVEQAIDVYRDAMVIDPDNEDIRHKAEALLIKQGGENRRIRFFVELANANKSDTEVLQVAAKALIGARHWAEAETVLRRILEAKPDDIPNRLALLHVWTQMGRADETLVAAKKLGQTAGDIAPALMLSVAESLNSGGHRSEAVELLRDYNARNPLNENVAIGLVSLLIEDKQQDQALAILEKIKAGAPDNFLATTMMAEVYASDNRYPEAHALLQGIPAEVREKNTPALDLVRAGLYINEGVKLEREEQFARADALYQQALGMLDAIPPQSDADEARRILELRINIWINRGVMLQDQDKLVEAEAAYKKAVELDPNSPEALNTLGYFYAETNQKLDEGRRFIQRALASKPNAAHIIDSLGWILYREGKFEEAIVQLQRAAKGLDGQPEAAEVYDHLGDALKAAGKLEEAKQAWQKALDLKPTDIELEPIQKKIEQAAK